MSEYDNCDTAEALSRIATQLKYLGNGDAGTPMGAIEAHGKFMSDAIRDGFAQLGEVIQEQTHAQLEIARGLHAIAEAIHTLAETLEPDDVEE